MAADGVSHWLSEAIVDFLRGPLYIHPLMGFIDEKCMIFTPEEENKFEYTTIHEEFKELVDRLLTDFLEELGVPPEQFYAVVSAEHSRDKLTGFVVQTILTVDDFLMFKAMMVKRNLDLTSQVLAAVDELRAAAAAVEEASMPTKGKTQKFEDDEAELAAALAASQAEGDRNDKVAALQRLMRSLQLQDEDVALAIAIAESLKDMAASQSELAELEQALALSLALEAEQRRLAAARAAGELAEGLSLRDELPPGAGAGRAAPSAAGAASSFTPGKPTKQEELLYRPFPEPRPLPPGAGPLPALGGLRPVGAKSGAPPLSPLDQLNIGPNQGADKLSAVAAAAAQAASLLNSSPAPLSDSAPTRSGGGADVGSGSGRFVPQPLHVGDRMPQAGGAAAPRERFVPQPLNLPDKPRRETGDVPSPDSLIMGGPAGTFAKHAGVRNRALGYKGEGGVGDMAALREAAVAAANTQKNLLAAKKAEGQGGDDAAAQAWLTEAKMKLVAQKNAERQAEMAAYKAEKGGAPKGKGGAAAGGDEMEAKRAALRDKLAQKMKQDMLQQP